MPTYVYKFVETGETIEVQQAFTDEALTEAVHPTTGRSMAVKKVFTPVGVTFKGGGFYKTDSRSGSKRSGAGSSGSSDGGDGSTSSTPAATGSGDTAGSSGSGAGSSSTSSPSSTSPAPSGS